MTTETLPVVAPLEPTTPIKPSEALRLGRLFHPIHNQEGLWFGNDGSACAMGAIHVGWGGSITDDWWSDNPTDKRMRALGMDASFDVGMRFDDAEHNGHDGDEVVLAYLEGLGL